jgi:hypothetical protein
MIKADPRVISAENVDRTRTVLVDTHSISTANRLLKQTAAPNFDFSYDEGKTLANFIQALVLYETIVVDSILLGSSSYYDIELALDLFPGIIRGVYLRDPDRHRIGHVVQQATSGWDDLPPGMSNEDWALLQSQTASEKPLLDTISKSIVHHVPPDLENDAEVIHWSEDEVLLPFCVLASTRTLSRAHYYLELASELGVPLVVDPVRSRYFDLLFRQVKKNLKDAPEKIIARFDSAVFQPAVEEDLISVNLSIPPVVEHVLRLAKKKRASLRDAILEVRESKHARDFRNWCSVFVSHAEGGRPGAKKQSEMLKEVDEVCRMWRDDEQEGVKYITRKLNLEHLPRIGGVLKAFNMHETITIKDPVLRPKKKYSYFLFLNDLLNY